MLSKKFQKLLKPRIFRMRVLWFALTVSLGIFVVVAYVVAAEAPPDHVPIPNFERRRYMVAAFAFVLLVLSFVLSSRLIVPDSAVQKVMSKCPDLDEMATRQGQLDQTRRELLNKLAPFEQRLLRLVNIGFFTSFLLRMALHEMIGFSGLMWALMSYNPQEVLPYVFVAVTLNALAFPMGIEPLEERARRFFE